MLSFKIEAKRKEMISYAKRYGYCAKETVKCSQELDNLLNQQWEQLNYYKHNRAINNTYYLAQ